jgi:hypothetical protein
LRHIQHAEIGDPTGQQQPSGVVTDWIVPFASVIRQLVEPGELIATTVRFVELARARRRSPWPRR